MANKPSSDTNCILVKIQDPFVESLEFEERVSATETEQTEGAVTQWIDRPIYRANNAQKHTNRPDSASDQISKIAEYQPNASSPDWIAPGISAPRTGAKPS
jgi:hypothetical protein